MVNRTVCICVSCSSWINQVFSVFVLKGMFYVLSNDNVMTLEFELPLHGRTVSLTVVAMWNMLPQLFVEPFHPSRGSDNLVCRKIAVARCTFLSDGLLAFARKEIVFSFTCFANFQLSTACMSLRNTHSVVASQCIDLIYCACCKTDSPSGFVALVSQSTVQPVRVHHVLLRMSALFCR